MIQKTMIYVALVLVLLISGCTSTVEEVKKEENVGKEVTVSGTVKDTIKIGDLQGYTLVDENEDEIGIASKSLPEEGSKVRVSGTLKNRLLLGYYIEEG